MAATAAPVALIRSAGESSISRPRRPALQNIVVPRSSAEESTMIGRRRLRPTGEIPPAT
jgi:hypothetical protein